MITLNKLSKELDFFKKMYDVVRIVDPVEKKVLDYRQNELDQTDLLCYDYWENDKICENCISVRAYLGNDSFMKLEQGPGFVMMVMALPVEGTRPVVLELLKNATGSMLLGSGDYNDGELLSDFITKLNDMIVKDSLTALYNRRFISDRLPAEIVKAVIKGWPISIIMLDVDNLKDINDTYGHQAGDEVLAEVGKTLEEKFHSELSWAARYGGDEFLICLNDTDDREAYQMAEALRLSLKQSLVKLQELEVSLTLSVGICTARGAALTAEELIEQADEQMYLAKNQGKDGISQKIYDSHIF